MYKCNQYDVCEIMSIVSGLRKSGSELCLNGAWNHTTTWYMDGFNKKKKTNKKWTGNRIVFNKYKGQISVCTIIL